MSDTPGDRLGTPVALTPLGSSARSQNANVTTGEATIRVIPWFISLER